MGKRILSLFLIPILFPLPAKADAGETVRLPIVMYYHVSEDPKQWNDYVISPAELEDDLRYLQARGYETISVRQLLDWQDGRFQMPEKPCMITFDDGFESTRRYAEPLLEAYGFCGVVAVIGSVCERFSQVEATDPDTDNLSWEEVRDMARRGIIEVQCHTWDLHGLSPRKGCARQRGESEAAYRYALSCDLSRCLAAARRHDVEMRFAIAYPYGSYSKETTRAVQDFGFRAAFTCGEKVNVLTGDAEQLYDLGRYNRPHGVSSENFFRKWEENS